MTAKKTTNPEKVTIGPVDWPPDGGQEPWSIGPVDWPPDGGQEPW